jgi:hypothetical protein
MEFHNVTVGGTCNSYWALTAETNLQTTIKKRGKGKGLPQQAEAAQGVPGRLSPRIFLTFGITRVVGCQPYAPAGFTPGEIPGTYF